MYFKSFFLLCFTFLSFLKADGSVSLAIEGNTEFIGKWKIMEAKIDGSKVNIRGKILFEKNTFSGNIGCNTFFGQYLTMDLHTLTLSPRGATQKKCSKKSINKESKFLKFFYGNFLLSRDFRGYLVLQNPRMILWLKPNNPLF